MEIERSLAQSNKLDNECAISPYKFLWIDSIPYFNPTPYKPSARDLEDWEDAYEQDFDEDIPEEISMFLRCTLAVDYSGAFNVHTTHAGSFFFFEA